jgi:protein TonB
MGFQALLFCPDDKTARAVTQVLSELEFSVESCTEPFAAVKKLMGAHFDAIVVDCDNEQNATLLFKSARTSTSNQASLAVAVVEGQAGVAKAFRIGANLVLTKPINVEQAKGTLRVARGLLRKGDPAKPAAGPAQTAAASSAPVARDKAAPAVNASSEPAVSAMSPAAPPAARKVFAPVLPRAKSPIVAAPAAPASAAETRPLARSAAPAKPASLSGTAASAPAPAREIVNVPPATATPAKPASEAGNISEVPAAAQPREPAKDAAASLTSAGVNAAAKSGGAKKVVLGIAAAVVVAAGLYAGWTHYKGHLTHLVSNPAAATVAPGPSAAASSAQPASTATPAARPGATTTAPAANVPSAIPSSARSSASSAASKGAPTEAPLVVKGGAIKAEPAAPDAPAPSVIGIAPDSGAALPSLGPTAASKPVLQRLNISQGVSQGLLIKKVAPVYPVGAARLRVEGVVELLATISKTGEITQVQVLKGDHRLTAAAVDAVKQWKYKPYLLNGEPVEIQTQVSVSFKMPQ